MYCFLSIYALVLCSFWSITTTNAFVSPPSSPPQRSALITLMASTHPESEKPKRDEESSECIHQEGHVQENEHYNRRNIMQKLLLTATGFVGGMVAPSTSKNGDGGSIRKRAANAAPPMAVIAEELGYFPVRNKQGDLVYIPKRVQRDSSDQAVRLAAKLREQGAAVFTAYWCPHCARQSELFGRQAWEEQIRRVECSPKGFGANPSLCLSKKVDGYPTWIIPAKEGSQRGEEALVISGERPLEELAQAVGFKHFDPKLETNLPPLPGAACKQ